MTESLLKIDLQALNLLSGESPGTFSMVANYSNEIRQYPPRPTERVLTEINRDI